MARAAGELVDGNGAARVVEAMGGRPMTLRRARSGDAALLFEWTNDPVVRASSFVTKPVEWEEHVRWFEARLASASSTLYVASDAAGQPLGLVRFERTEDGRAEIGVSVAATFRGQGRAAPLLRAGVSAYWRDVGPCPVDAYIRPTNEASLRAFRHAGFVDDGNAMVKGVEAVRTVRAPALPVEKGGANAHRNA
jgi:RimJ/RimL family protein N-acetyltransferase